uniref:Ig-like domain-containing protein n=1 Tax=Myripristis murdjan TaxID=586833 RepID=A0A667YKR6_9TELE
MDLTVLVVLQVMSWPCVSALFTVQAPQRFYEAEFEGDVVMGCRFQPVPANLHDDLTVTWQRVTSTSSMEVYRMENGMEKLGSQDPQYRGRVRLLTDELKDGWAKLQVSRLRISDTASYQCLIQIGDADYKTITLSVKAPYKSVNKTIQKSADGDEVKLICRSEGHPAASPTWHDGNLVSVTSNKSIERTPDQLYRVTSWIQVKASEKNNYTCSFSEDRSATFHIPDEIPKPHVRNDALIIALTATVVLVVVIIAVLRHRRQKGNHEGQPVNLQALLPEAGQIHLLEGAPESGKTTIAQMLKSSWAGGPTHGLFNQSELSVLELLLSVDCSNVESDLFHEIMTQLCLEEKKSTEDDLRTLLSGSTEALLLLDGYREGNQVLDDSLRRFLREKKVCRVLVTACPGHCPILKETVGTRGVLQLQNVDC